MLIKYHQGNVSGNNNEMPLHTCYHGQTLELPVLVRIWSDRKSHSLLLGTQNGTTTLEDWWFPTKHTLTIQSRNHTPWCLPNGTEILCPSMQKAEHQCL